MAPFAWDELDIYFFEYLLLEKQHKVAILRLILGKINIGKIYMHGWFEFFSVSSSQRIVEYLNCCLGEWETVSQRAPIGLKNEENPTWDF